MFLEDVAVDVEIFTLSYGISPSPPGGVGAGAGGLIISAMRIADMAGRLSAGVLCSPTVLSIHCERSVPKTVIDPWKG